MIFWKYIYTVPLNVLTIITLKCCLKICWKDLYSSYLFLDNKPPQNLVAQSNHYFIMLTHSVGREFRKGTEEMSLLHNVWGLRWKDLQSWGWLEELALEQTSYQEPTFNKMAYSPTHQSVPCKTDDWNTHQCPMWSLHVASHSTVVKFWKGAERRSNSGVWAAILLVEALTIPLSSRERNTDPHHLRGGHERRLKKFVVFFFFKPPYSAFGEYSGEQLFLLPPSYALVNVVMQDME